MARRIERERRFLLERFPEGAKATRIRRITDRYIEGTRLRLREERDDNGPSIFKLTQKLPAPGGGARQGFITTIYLTRDEVDVIAQLPARKLSKCRSIFPPFGIDVFEGELQDLVLAEAEFDSDDSASALAVPSFVLCEASADIRFTGGSLVRASRPELAEWLSEYGVALK